MKRILVLGAGQSSPCLIDRLLEAPVEVRVADRDADAAARAVAGAARGAAVGFDATDEAGLRAEVGAADIVVNLLAPSFQVPVARACLAEGRSMVSASYRSSGLAALADEAEARGLSFASELGLDPGLDHMSAMRLLETLRGEGRTILAFESYGAGIADPDTVDNPLGYVVTWNPRNVVMAGEAGARFVDEGGIKVVPYPEVFRRTWTVEVPGLGPLDAYPNRDSFAYVELYGLKHARRVLRATMRAPGFTEAWYALAKLGLANETITIPGLADLTWRQLTQCFLPEGRDRNLETRLADHLGLHRTSAALRTLRWLGLFERTRVGALTGEAVRTPAEAVRALLTERLRLSPEGRDLVCLHHRIEASGREGEPEGILARSTLIARGEAGGRTAMARTVGLPAALATLGLLSGEIDAPGCPIPTEPRLYRVLLPQLEQAGLRFDEAREPNV